MFPFLLNLLLITLPGSSSSTPGANRLTDTSFSFEDIGPFRQSSIGQICKPPFLICSDPNAVCRRKPSHLMSFCKCAPSYFFDRKFSKCTRSIAIGGPCSESRECQAFDRHSYCDYGQLLRNREPVCVCQSRYVFNHEKQRCVHCKNTLADCREPLSSTSIISSTSSHTNSITGAGAFGPHSLAKYKFALLIKIILIVIGFFLLLSLTFCFFIKILNGYANKRRGHCSPRDVQVYISTDNCCVDTTTSTVNRSTPTPPSSSTRHGDERPLFARVNDDKPPSYEEAVSGGTLSSPGRRNLIISLNPSAPQAPNML